VVELKRSWHLSLSGALVLLSLNGGCKPITSPSLLKNIYKADSEDPSRRHKANERELKWTVKLGGCSGVLLSPLLLITAHHCKVKPGMRGTSGSAIANRGPADLTITQIMDESAALDYVIAAFSLQEPLPSDQTFPPYIATRSEDVYMSLKNGEGETAFTVGFPEDKSRSWRGTYAEGQMKGFDKNRLFFNIGVINGSSGGGLLKKENFMLVGITTGGSKTFQEEGWNNSSLDNPENWNFGTPSWLIYADSKTLREQFPEGSNRALQAGALPRTKLYLSLAEGSEKNTLALRVSASLETETVLLCPEKSYPCNSDTPGARPLAFQGAAGGRTFYSAKLGLSKSDIPVFSLVAFNKAGAAIGQRKVELHPNQKEAPSQ
jgi:V8-like Glu-specific endopeptidase